MMRRMRKTGNNRHRDISGPFSADSSSMPIRAIMKQNNETMMKMEPGRDLLSIPDVNISSLEQSPSKISP